MYAEGGGVMKRFELAGGYLIPALILCFLLVSNSFTRLGFFRGSLFTNEIMIGIEDEEDRETAEFERETDELEMPDARELACIEPEFSKGQKLFDEGKYADAIRTWQPSPEDTCKIQVLLNNIGVAYARLQKLRHADSCFTEAIMIDSSYARAFYNRGSNRARAMREESAKQDYQTVLSLNPNYGSALYNLGVLYMRMNAPDSALFYLKQGLERGADKARTWYNIGVVFARQGNLDNAQVAYEEAVRFDPGYTAPRYAGALSAVKQRDSVRAIRLLSEIVRIEPKHTRSLLALTRIAVARRSFGQAGEYIARILQIDPNSVDALYEQAKVLGLQGYDQKALAMYRQITARDPQNPRVYYNIGVNLSDLDRPAEALKAYLRALNLDPYFWKAQYNVGVHYLREGKTDKAVRYLETATQIASDHAEGKYNLGLAYLRQDRFTDAENTFREVIELSPGHVESYYNLGYISLSQRHHEQALDFFARALEEDPRHAKSVFNTALIYRRQDRFARSAETFLQAAEIRKEYPEAYYNAALCYRDLGQGREALKMLDMALTQRSAYAQAMLVKADILADSKKPDASLATLDRLKKMQGLSAGELTRMARRYADFDQAGDALELCRQALRLSPGRGELQLECAEMEARLGEVDSALVRYEKVLGGERQDEGIWYAYAKLLAEQGKGKKAIASLDSAIFRKPDYERARELQAALYKKAGRHEKSADAYYSLYKINGEYEDLVSAASAYLSGNNYKLSLDLYRQAKTAFPDEWAPRYYVPLILTRLSRLGEALEAWEEFSERYPDDHRGYYQMGKIAFGQKNWSTARDYFQRALGLSTYDRTWYYLAETFYRLENYTKASEAVAKYRELDPDSRRGKTLQRRIRRKIQS